MDAVIKGSPLPWAQHQAAGEFPEYALRAYELNGRVWLTSAGGPSPACVSFAMSPEQAWELIEALTKCASMATDTLRMVRGMAEDHRALQRQVQRPDLATQVATGEML